MGMGNHGIEVSNSHDASNSTQLNNSGIRDHHHVSSAKRLDDVQNNNNKMGNSFENNNNKPNVILSQTTAAVLSTSEDSMTKINNSSNNNSNYVVKNTDEKGELVPGTDKMNGNNTNQDGVDTAVSNGDSDSRLKLEVECIQSCDNKNDDNNNNTHIPVDKSKSTINSESNTMISVVGEDNNNNSEENSSSVLNSKSSRSSSGAIIDEEMDSGMKGDNDPDNNDDSMNVNQRSEAEKPRPPTIRNDNLIRVSYVKQDWGGLRVSDIRSVTELIESLDSLEEPIVIPLPRSRDFYNQWARNPRNDVIQRLYPRNNNGPVASKCYSMYQIMQKDQMKLNSMQSFDDSAQKEYNKLVPPSSDAIDSLDSIINHYKHLFPQNSPSDTQPSGSIAISTPSRSSSPQNCASICNGKPSNAVYSNSYKNELKNNTVQKSDTGNSSNITNNSQPRSKSSMGSFSTKNKLTSQPINASSFSSPSTPVKTSASTVTANGNGGNQRSKKCPFPDYDLQTDGVPDINVQQPLPKAEMFDLSGTATNTYVDSQEVIPALASSSQYLIPDQFEQTKFSLHKSTSDISYLQRTNDGYLNSTNSTLLLSVDESPTSTRVYQKSGFSSNDILCRSHNELDLNSTKDIPRNAIAISANTLHLTLPHERAQTIGDISVNNTHSSNSNNVLKSAPSTNYYEDIIPSRRLITTPSRPNSNSKLNDPQELSLSSYSTRITREDRELTREQLQQPRRKSCTYEKQERPSIKNGDMNLISRGRRANTAIELGVDRTKRFRALARKAPNDERHLRGLRDSLQIQEIGSCESEDTSTSSGVSVSVKTTRPRHTKYPKDRTRAKTTIVKTSGQCFQPSCVYKLSPPLLPTCTPQLPVTMHSMLEHSIKPTSSQSVVVTPNSNHGHDGCSSSQRSRVQSTAVSLASVHFLDLTHLKHFLANSNTTIQHL